MKKMTIEDAVRAHLEKQKCENTFAWRKYSIELNTDRITDAIENAKAALEWAEGTVIAGRTFFTDSLFQDELIRALEGLRGRYEKELEKTRLEAEARLEERHFKKAVNQLAEYHEEWLEGFCAGCAHKLFHPGNSTCPPAWDCREAAFDPFDACCVRRAELYQDPEVINNAVYFMEEEEEAAAGVKA